MIIVQFAISDSPDCDSEIKAYLLDDKTTTPHETMVGKSILNIVESIIRIVKEEGAKDD